MGVTKRSVKSLEPETKHKPPLVGLKTLQGANWADRYYLMTEAPAKEPLAPKAKKHRPPVFKLG